MQLAKLYSERVTVLNKILYCILFVILAAAPCGAADYIYISAHGAGLLRFDMDTGTSSTVSGASQYAYGSSFNPDGSQLLLASSEGTVMAQRFDTSDMSILATYAHEFTLDDIETNMDESRYYVSNWDGDKVRVFNSGLSLITDITVSRPRFLQMSPSRTLLFAFCDPDYDNLVSVIDTSTNTVVNTTDDTNLYWAQGSVGFNSDESKYYIGWMNGARTETSLLVYNASTHALIKEIPLTYLGISGTQGSIHTRSFALGPNGRYLYMAGGQYGAEYCFFTCTPEVFNFIVLDTTTDDVQYYNVLDNARFLFLSADGQSLYVGSDTQILEVDVDSPTTVLNTYDIPDAFQTFAYASHYRDATVSSGTADLTSLLPLFYD